MYMAATSYMPDYPLKSKIQGRPQELSHTRGAAGDLYWGQYTHSKVQLSDSYF